MKKIIAICMFGLLLTACQTSPGKLGEPFIEKDPKTVEEVLSALQQQGELKNVQLAGKIDKVCMEKGCWLSMKSSDGHELLMTFKEEKFAVPINSLGKQIVAMGDARMKQDSVEGKLETSYEFESSGLVFK